MLSVHRLVLLSSRPPFVNAKGNHVRRIFGSGSRLTGRQSRLPFQSRKVEFTPSELPVNSPQGRPRLIGPFLFAFGVSIAVNYL